MQMMARRGMMRAQSSSSSKDPTKQALAKVFTGQVPLRVEAHHSDAIGWILDMAKELKIKVTIDGLRDAGSNSQKVVDTNTSFIVGPVFAATDSEKIASKLNWLSKATGIWAISTFGNSPRSSRTLRLHAATAVKFGVSRENALKAITINAAKILGISRRTGSLEIGKQADIAVFGGDPLDPSVSTALVICGGKVIHQSKAKRVAIVKRPDVELPKKWPAKFAVKTQRLLQKGEFKPGTILIENGKIAAVGEMADPNVRTFDVKSFPVTPGLIVAHTHLGQANLLKDDSESDTTHLRAVAGVDPTSDAAKQMLKGGFIHALVAPDSSNTSAGLAGEMRLGAADYIINPAIANKFVIADSARRTDRFPSSMNSQIDLLEDILDGKIPESRLFVSSQVQKALQAEKNSVIAALRDKETVAIIEADSNPEIIAALELLEKFNLKGSLLTSGHIKPVYTDKMLQLHAGVIVKSISGTEYDAYFERLAKISNTGVPIAFAGESPEQILMTAALAVSAGASRKKVLLGLTSNAAKICGLQKGLGEFAQDDRADFVIWNGSPLDIASKPLHVFVDGKSQ